MNVETPKLRVPLGIDGSHFAYVEQDSTDEVAQCVTALLLTETGERIDEPEYGIPDLAFRQVAVDADGSIEAAINEWEPRARYMLDEDDIDQITATVTVEVAAGEEDSTA